MAKEPTPSRKSPEEIAAMEAEVRAWRAEEQAEAMKARREAGKPLLELAGSDGYAAVKTALPELDKLAAERGDDFPNLRVYVDAIRNGMVGIDQLAAGMPVPETDEA